MDAVTYPQPEVERFAQSHFVPVRVNILSGDAKQIAYLHNVWTPGSFVLDAEREHERRNGFLPPEEFGAWMRIALGNRAVNLGRYQDAAKWFSEVSHQFAQTTFAPRALYWEGVARYKISHGHQDLYQPWAELAKRYPSSSWALASSFAVAAETA